jgi:hypothetical protein
MKRLAILALGVALTGCADAAINLGIQLGTDLVGAGISSFIGKPSSGTKSSDQGTSHLVCNPVGEKVTDPTTECHSATE